MKFLYFFICSAFLLLNVQSLLTMSPALNPDDQKLLAQLDQEINEFVGKLSPDEQKQFWNDVEELSQEMNKMSPDQLESFVQGVFQENLLPEPEKPSQPETPVAKPAEKLVEQPKQQPVVIKPATNIKEIIDLLDTLSGQINSLLKKAQIIPFFDGKVDQWIKKGAIRPILTANNWATIKNLLELLLQKLHKVKERDKTTKQYKYIDLLSEQKKLLEALKALECDLCQCVSLISVTEMEAAGISKASTQAIQTTLNSLSKAFATVNLSEELEKIFSQYESKLPPRKGSQKAGSASVAKSTPTSYSSTPSYGTTARSGTSYGSQPSYSGGYSRGYENTYNGGGNFYSPDNFEEKTSHAGESKKPSNEKVAPATGAGGNKTTPATAAEGKKGESPEKVDETKRDSVADGYLDDIVLNVEGITNLVKQNESILNDLKKKLTDKDPVDISFATIFVPQANKKAEKIVDKIGALKQRVTRLKSEPIKQLYKKELETADLKKAFSSLDRIASDIKKIEDEWDKVSTLISPDKQYAYFAQGVPSTLSLQQTIPAPQSLFTLQKSLQAVGTAVKEFDKKKAAAR